ncbi:hypothetical protein DX914_16260 [Lysobacter silvisoli]|uniref:Uncharacterized protein n=1 Tax=Lysobacter silvisoli TaxID=2293254 RepID=A0A371JY27_9GAMM|nr:hypothetical protein DX914_16260 [Lysobacter silvisoli]
MPWLGLAAFALAGLGLPPAPSAYDPAIDLAVVVALNNAATAASAREHRGVAQTQTHSRIAPTAPRPEAQALR